MRTVVVLGIYLVQVLILLAVAASVFGYGGFGAVVAVFTMPLLVVVAILWFIVNRQIARERRAAEASAAEE